MCDDVNKHCPPEPALNVLTYYMLYVLALKNSSWLCVASYPSCLCCIQGMG